MSIAEQQKQGHRNKILMQQLTGRSSEFIAIARAFLSLSIVAPDCGVTRSDDAPISIAIPSAAAIVWSRVRASSLTTNDCQNFEDMERILPPKTEHSRSRCA